MEWGIYFNGLNFVGKNFYIKYKAIDS